MPRAQVKFVCRECGYETARWLGRCPECTQWATLEETTVSPGGAAGAAGAGQSAPRGGRSRRESVRAGLARAYAEQADGVVPITAVPSQASDRQSTGIDELDLVLGGGLVAASCILLAGDPGVGKSTLLLGMAAGLVRQGLTLLYITGEESAAQIRLRAGRIEALHPGLLVLAETNILAAVAAIHAHQPAVVLVDSIQTMYHPEVSSHPGSVAQVRECAALLVDVAKSLPACIWLIGHVTKDGSVAGPRTLEHMVDVVLQVEGDRSYPYRILRGLKNRYGATDEIGVFEMVDGGMQGVTNPSRLFLEETLADGLPSESRVAGTAVAAALEGRRVILAEVQALVVPSPWGAPRRTAMGVDQNRLALIIAVLSRRAGLKLVDKDIYVKVAGGVRLVEPGVDLAIAVAVASAELDRPVRAGSVFAGEVGLGGEVRQIARVDQRLRESAKLGFDRLVTRGGAGAGAHASNPTGNDGKPGSQGLLAVENVGQALAWGLTPPRGRRPSTAADELKGGPWQT